MSHVAIDGCDEAVKRFVLSLAPGPGGTVLELGGRPVAHVLPAPTAAADDWDDARDACRCALIDREIAGDLTAAEAAELQALQAAMLRHRRRVAPLPLADARRLHQELLVKAAGGVTAPFEYPDRPHARRHGPRGYADYPSYRPWLRDEFTFRCAHCLRREAWGLVRGTFAVDHFTPAAVRPDLVALKTPEGNTRPDGVADSHFARRVRGELPPTY